MARTTTASAAANTPAAVNAPAADSSDAATGATTLRRDFPLADHTGVLLHKAGLLIAEEADQALQAAGYRLRDFLVLAALAGGAELSQQDLSQVINLDPTTVVALIDELERAGLVDRRRNPADRRRYILGLTEAGRQNLTDAQQIAERAEEAFFAGLPEGGRELLHAMLSGLLADRWPNSVCT
ncbi:MarR family winged helix-turn-helix transcriptional regulator [Kitasatospora sp. NBC_01287]|uniref:MarR family winged helix-turn-helix transcriptional regulator n=1 Tax=Kitasatospora sp. NBC_01287 TaxID=2903573 RepID=UPI00225387BF|nr:MarR family winged helix-turn-helix transcriptional regulator [Kitasatospora sp. NBC_01287]MCX4747146.1 MarR family winged helix-turn-helix transcriptional regulator [Kitasatospora sp. NBC_01287]